LYFRILLKILESSNKIKMTIKSRENNE
jgi:hypothetical protein